MTHPSRLPSENCSSRKNSADPNRNFLRGYLLSALVLFSLVTALYVPYSSSGAQTFQTIRDSAPPGLDSSIRSSTDQKGATALVDTIVKVTEPSLQGWFFFNEGPVGSGSFVNGPGTPPIGPGSAQLVVDATGRHNLARIGPLGQPLAQITQLTYSSYQVSANPAAAINLSLQVDYNVTDTDNSYQGRLIFEPSNSGTAILQNTWQAWDARAGLWYASGAPGNTLCTNTPATLCTWDQLLAAWPNLGIHNLVGAIIFRAGGPVDADFTGNVDNFILGIGADRTIYDFGPLVLGPTAASVSISGRVVSHTGEPVRNARIILTSPAGAIRSGLSNPFGYFTIDGVVVGRTYQLEVQSKQFIFTPRVLNVVDEVSGMVLTAEP